MRARGSTPKIARKGAARRSGLGRTRWAVERALARLHRADPPRHTSRPPPTTVPTHALRAPLATFSPPRTASPPSWRRLPRLFPPPERAVVRRREQAGARPRSGRGLIVYVCAPDEETRFTVDAVSAPFRRPSTGCRGVRAPTPAERSPSRTGWPVRALPPAGSVQRGGIGNVDVVNGKPVAATDGTHVRGAYALLRPSPGTRWRVPGDTPGAAAATGRIAGPPKPGDGVAGPNGADIRRRSARRRPGRGGTRARRHQSRRLRLSCRARPPGPTGADNTAWHDGWEGAYRPAEAPTVSRVYPLREKGRCRWYGGVRRGSLTS